MTTLTSKPAVKPTAPVAPELPAPRKPITLRSIGAMVERGEKFACLTCYDATTARWLEEAGVPVLLAGDSAAEVILGLPGTIHAPLDFLLLLTAAVKRGAPLTHVMGDMPFLSYQCSEAEGIRNAGRFMTEGTADSVKLEVDASFAPLVKKIVRTGVPVVAHIGLKPQQAKLKGYRATGRTANEAQHMVDEALILEDAGASMLLIEAAPDEVSQRIVQRTNIPVIGCGGGPSCHGQIVVIQDLLGLSPKQPSFAPPNCALGEAIRESAERWIDDVKTGHLGDHPYRMAENEAQIFRSSSPSAPLSGSEKPSS